MHLPGWRWGGRSLRALEGVVFWPWRLEEPQWEAISSLSRHWVGEEAFRSRSQPQGWGTLSLPIPLLLGPVSLWKLAHVWGAQVDWCQLFLQGPGDPCGSSSPLKPCSETVLGCAPHSFPASHLAQRVKAVPLSTAWTDASLAGSEMKLLWSCMYRKDRMHQCAVFPEFSASVSSTTIFDISAQLFFSTIFKSVKF